MTTDVRQAYARRAREYIAALGTMSAVHPLDELLVSGWARSVNGPVLDAGCGPGHWTSHLAAQGIDARGIDQVPEFVASARAAYPVVPYRLGSVDALPYGDACIAGVLAWYSLIHHEPPSIGTPLAEFARVLRPGGRVLIGFFEGAVVEQFDHAVVGAHRWSLEALGTALSAAGFDVVEEHVRRSAAHRPHGAVIAVRRDG